ncbi:hypothetical protein HPB47_006826 [Ixodes persulcatus]|uniref:Uncharacterized protein n=1 Tax=Ixodes persulcatus TaxID=34615 RepID=A0AC60P9S4_IXOPE|nr:hypothetical protein HPB47_006826 [Ixodes persulcatus]
MLRLGVYADKHHQSFAPSNIIHHVEMRCFAAHVILLCYDGDGEKLIRELTTKYLKTEKSGNLTFEYEGDSNVEMDEAFT